MSSRRKEFPLLGGIGSIPWWIAEQAYINYAGKYGSGQSLERLADRGGFGVEELDVFYPNWREEGSLIKQLQAELEKHRWIPVSEGLPEKGSTKCYAVTDGKDWWETWWGLGGDDEWEYHNDYTITHYKDIILPESD